MSYMANKLLSLRAGQNSAAQTPGPNWTSMDWRICATVRSRRCSIGLFLVCDDCCAAKRRTRQLERVVGHAAPRDVADAMH